MTFETFKSISNIEIYNKLVTLIPVHLRQDFEYLILHGNPEEMNLGYEIAFRIAKHFNVGFIL